MKTNPDDAKQESKRIRQFSSTKRGPSAETVVFAGLGAAAVLAIVLSVSSFFGPNNPGVVASVSAAPSSPPVVRKLSLVQYIQLGRWRADALTLVAEAKFLLARDYSEPRTNHDVIRNIQTPVSINPTNSNWGTPTA